MSELEVIATFDTPQTARTGTKLLNSWFSHIIEGSEDDEDDEKFLLLEELFDEFGLAFSDYSGDGYTDIEWGEIPEAYMEGNKIVVGLYSKTGVDIVRELFEAMGAYEVNVHGEED
ncbi:MAG: hypothetical protein KC505_06390 [Myxococcales bacterium]|nr:hypothetical protein [Myxococcales bacterium]USN51015.1 MAG: hypothetical protein H6731_00965 [Myxococcales bacterium]